MQPRERGASMPPLSACLIVKDEEAHIEACLRSLRPHVDEIVVVDTGSSDATVRLAAPLAARVLHFEWTDDFSAARNFSIAQAAHDMVFITDADNTVAHWDDAETARFLAAENAARLGCVRVVNIVETAGEERRSAEYEPKLFDRRFFHYEGIVHEQVMPLGEQAAARVHLDITVLHGGYSRDELARKRKTERNIALLQKALMRGDDPYLLYQLGKSRAARQEYGKAVDCFARALALRPNPNLSYVRQAVIAYGYALIQTQRYSEALFLERYRPFYAQNPDYTFLLAYANMMNGRFQQAFDLFSACTRMPDGEVEGVNRWLPCFNIGVIFESLGQKEQALRYYAMCGEYERAKERIAALNAEK